MHQNIFLLNIIEISRILPGDKLNIRKQGNNFLFLISNKNIFRPIIRSFNNDSAMKTCYYINNFLSFNFNNLMKTNLDEEYINLLKKYFEESKNGILNLKKTYNNRPDIYFNLTCIYIRILNIIQEISKITSSYEPFILN